MTDPYETLGVKRDATPDDIKKAFRKLSHTHHPDKGGDAAKFQEINQAYQILSDPNKKAQFDRFGSTGPAGAGGPQGGGGGFNGNFGGFDFNFGGSGGGGFGDIFEDLFGSAFATVGVEVQISPVQAILGADIDLTFEGEKIKLSIPQGTQDGQTFVFRGKGRQHRRGRGDLQITVRVIMPNPRRMSRRERELWEELKRLAE